MTSASPLAAAAAAATTTRTKRAASSSVSPSKHAAKAPRVGTKGTGEGTAASKTDDFDDDLLNDADFDSDALAEAAALAEEEETKSRTASSQTSAGKASSSQTSASTGTTGSVAPSQPRKAAPLTSSKPASDTASTSEVFFSPPADAHLLKHGDIRVEQDTMDPAWYARLRDEIKASYFIDLKKYLSRELGAGKRIFPPAHLVHSWSRLTPLHTVKVVVVGQDPYHGPNQACGHSFSVPRGVPVPGSLQNIYKELVNEYGGAFQPPKHGCLDGWAKQGVLLLNACLTVTAGQAGSHHNQGWERFTQQILRAIAADAAHAPKASVKSSKIASMFGKAAPAAGGAAGPAPSSQESNGGKAATTADGGAGPGSASKGVVFLAWGLPAQKTLAAAGITERSPNVLLLKSPHPSPLSAHRGFLGNGHFKTANEWLENPARFGPGGGIRWGVL